jgi:uncharacterized membrane protein
MAALPVEPHKSSIGNLDANVVALLAYLAAGIIGWIPYIGYIAWAVPLVFFFMEKSSTFVKFHAMQAFVLNAISAIIGFLLTVIIGGVVGAAAINDLEGAMGALAAVAAIGVIVTIISLIFTIFAIIALVNAYKYKMYYIPLIGKLAEKFAGKKAA